MNWVNNISGAPFLALSLIKMKSISAFKRGFGGKLYLQCSGEYFHTKDYFHKIYSMRLQEYEQSRWGNEIILSKKIYRLEEHDA